VIRRLGAGDAIQLAVFRIDRERLRQCRVEVRLAAFEVRQRRQQRVRLQRLRVDLDQILLEQAPFDEPD
jgi:hypothetical protein